MHIHKETMVYLNVALYLILCIDLTVLLMKIATLSFVHMCVYMGGHMHTHRTCLLTCLNCNQNDSEETYLWNLELLLVYYNNLK